jgi:FkbM family methyltransferase
MVQTTLARLGIYYAKRQYQPFGIDWLWDLSRVTPKPTVGVVIDVGANEGQTTKAVLAAFPTTVVHAFEPIEATFALLRRGFESDARVHLNKLAVSDKMGVARMRRASYSPASRIVADAAADDDAVVAVETITLDQYCEARGLGCIDILKTDTEGHDLAVLKGARGLFAGGRVNWVLTEATFEADDAAHSLFGPIHDWLAEQAMTPWGFYEQFHIDGGRQLMFLNVLFAKRRSTATVIEPRP